MKHGVLKTWHPMIGIDLHQVLIPPAPLTPAPVPHCTAMVLVGTTLTAQYTEKLFTDAFGWTMIKGTDIGPLIPHIGSASILLAIEIPLSSSKSHFGSSRYKTEKGPVATSLFFAINPNLNCGTPVPWPLGMVFAIATHRVDMSPGDVLAGFLSLIGDAALQTAFNKLGGWAGGKMAGWVGNLYGRIGAELLMNPNVPMRIIGPLFSLGMAKGGFGRLAARFGETAMGVVFGFFFGGPMGADAGTAGAPTPGGAVGGLVGSGADWVGEQYDQSQGTAVDPDQAMRDYQDNPITPDYSGPFDSGPTHMLGGPD